MGLGWLRTPEPEGRLGGLPSRALRELKGELALEVHWPRKG